MPHTATLYCACGQVCLDVLGAAITSTECHCHSCRAAAARLQALPAAPRYPEANGGTRFVLYRKDRVRFLVGQDLLRSFRLGGEATTRRIVASCCNTPVCLEFRNGHWLSLYGCLWAAGALPALEMRTMTRDLADPSVLDDSVPNLATQSARFFTKLLGAWIAMGFRTPSIPVKGELHA